MNLIAEARTLAEEGYRVFPTLGKRPAIVGWQEAATDNVDAVEDLFMPVMDNGIGIGVATGRGLFVVDIDRRDGPEVRPLLAKLPATRTVLSRKGLHLYFKTGLSTSPPLIANRARIMRDIDVRGDGGLVVAPPSTGKRYYDRCAPVPAPQFLLDRIIGEKREPIPALGQASVDTACAEDLPRPIPRGLAKARSRILRARSGYQGSTLFKAAMFAGINLAADGTYPAEACRAYLIAVGQSMPDYDERDPWTLKAITGHVDRGLARGIAVYERNYD